MRVNGFITTKGHLTRNAIRPTTFRGLNNQRHEMEPATQERQRSKDILMSIFKFVQKRCSSRQNTSAQITHPCGLPNLNDLDNHFLTIGHEQTQPYLTALKKLINAKVPVIPSKFAFKSGWVRYSADGSHFETVEAPEGDAIVFDVETVVKEGGLPALAVALSSCNWYSWCSSSLVEGGTHRVEKVTPESLIPLGSCDRERVVVAQFAAFDRSYVKEEYDAKQSKRRFLDTLSMHNCVSGQSAAQKLLSMTRKKWNEKAKETGMEESQRERPLFKWEQVSSLSNLADMHKFYCGEKIEKSLRNTFVTGSSDDIRDQFVELMKYCFYDVKATRDVLCKLLPLFLERSPHPASFFGLMELCTGYLPVNENWSAYINRSDAKYDSGRAEIQVELKKLAEETSKMSNDGSWQEDPWLWDLNWSMSISRNELQELPQQSELSIRGKCKRSKANEPKWFRDLCAATSENLSQNCSSNDSLNISLRKRCVPKILKLMWDGYPLHYHYGCGWGYLVPESDGSSSPLAEAVRMIKDKVDKKTFASFSLKEELSEIGDCSHMDSFIDWAILRKAYKNVDQTSQDKENAAERINKENMTMTAIDIGIKGLSFRRLPHKFGIKYNVGDPLTSDFIERFYGNFLTAWECPSADRVLRLIRQSARWDSWSRKKVHQQMVSWTGEGHGVILPRVMPSGTVSRQPEEWTWLNRDAPHEDRIGSELCAMVQAPSGTHFVGAYFPLVDIWTASILSDVHFQAEKCRSGLDWITCNGEIINGTKVYSELATKLDCDPEHAKLLEFARMYGQNEKDRSMLLKKLKPNLSRDEAFLCITNCNDHTTSTDRYLQLALQNIAKASKTPILGVEFSQAIHNKTVPTMYKHTRAAAVVQSSTVDYLHLLLSSVKDLFSRWNIDGRLVMSSQKEAHFMVRSEDRLWAALAVHMSNILAQLMVTSRLGIKELSFEVSPFHKVHMDRVLRANVNDDVVTPSNPDGLQKGCAIPNGQALNIFEVVDKLSKTDDCCSSD